LLAVIGFTAAYYAHLIWALLDAAFALTLVSAPERKVLRDQPSRKAPGMGFFSRFWGFPPLFRFARGSPLRYAALIVLSLLCAFLFSIVALLPLILSGPIDQISLIGKRCAADDACLTTQTVQLFYLFFLPLAALVVCLVLGWLGQLVVRRLLRFSLEALQQADTRPPVLFLRAFATIRFRCERPKWHCSVAFSNWDAAPIRSISSCSKKRPLAGRSWAWEARPTSVRLTARPAAILPARPGRLPWQI